MEPYLELEREYARFTGSKHAVSCNSGTAALHLALLSLGIGPGDEVIVPDFTMAAVAFAVSYTGATPVFADVSLEHYGVTRETVEPLITERTKAIIVVHTYGRLAPIDDIIALGIPVIEDACEAQGAIRNSKAYATAYSFYRNKIIHAEEGGMLTSHNQHCATQANYFKNMAFSAAHDYFHEHIGFNYRMPNAQAKLALESLRRYQQNADSRKYREKWYDEMLLNPKPKRDAVWFYETEGPRSMIKRFSRVRLAFKPLSSFPMYGAGKGLPNARKLSETLILLPADPSVSRDEARRYIDELQKRG